MKKKYGNVHIILRSLKTIIVKKCSFMTANLEITAEKLIHPKLPLGIIQRHEKISK